MMNASDFEALMPKIINDYVRYQLEKLEVHIRWLKKDDAANYVKRAINCLDKGEVNE